MKPGKDMTMLVPGSGIDDPCTSATPPVRTCTGVPSYFSYCNSRLRVEDFQSIDPKMPLDLVKADRLPQHKKGELFLRGPVPMKWLAIAARQKGKALHVAIVIWQQAGMKKSSTVSLPNKQLKEFGVDRFAKARALKELSKVGLITVERHPGRSPVITIKDVDR